MILNTIDYMTNNTISNNIKLVILAQLHTDLITINIMTTNMISNMTNPC